MSKYTNELKLEIVEKYLNSKVSITQLSKEYHIDKGDIQKWRDAYLEYGYEGICAKNGTYTGDFRCRVVKYVLNNNASFRQTAAHFNIPSYTTVGSWVETFKTYGVEALYLEKRGCKSPMKKKRRRKSNPDSNKDLLAELKQLRMEVEYLKKLNALVQERENSKKLTR